jgi:hypothetical protein
MDLALPITDEVWSQDWWAMMVAAAFGQIVKLDEPTIPYRRHSANDSLLNLMLRQPKAWCIAC